ncbi:MAG: hypothetical protein AMK75_05050, partial [Planctomycetes bacterium SM23_65]
MVLLKGGRAREARKVVEAIESRNPHVRVKLGDRERGIVEYLKTQLAKPQTPGTARAPVARTLWPQFGGNPAHDATMPGEILSNVKIAEMIIPGYGPARTTAVTWKRGDVLRAVTVNVLAGRAGSYAPFVPVHARGRIFIHDDSGMLAFRLNSISPDWVVGEVGEPPQQRYARVVVNGIVRQVGVDLRVHVCAYQNGVVYAALGRAPTGCELWAVSETGKVLWRVTKEHEGFDWLSTKTEISDPVVVDDRLYVVTWQSDTYGRSCSLVSVNAADGRLVWRRFICSGPRTMGYRPMYGGPTLALPAVADGWVVVCSDAGGIAAADARTGELRWGF